MKVIRITYFQPNGKFHKEDTLFIKEGISLTEAMTKAIPDQIDEPDMYLYIEDSGDKKEPFIMPHLFKPGAKKKAADRLERLNAKEEK